MKTQDQIICEIDKQLDRLDAERKKFDDPSVVFELQCVIIALLRLKVWILKEGL